MTITRQGCHKVTSMRKVKGWKVFKDMGEGRELHVEFFDVLSEAKMYASIINANLIKIVVA